MKSKNEPYLKCSTCKKEYSLMDRRWQCDCGGILDVVEASLFLKESLTTRPMNFWRYREAFTMDDMIFPITLGEIMTPLLSVELEGMNIDYKLEYQMPTGSYKDRGIAVCVNHARRLGLDRLSEDSSGNAGASLAAYAASGGMESNIFVPGYTSEAKVNQISLYGGNIHLVEGNRSDTEKEAQKDREGIYYIGHSWNPLFEAGVKTIAYEIAEQRKWKSPDWIVTPVGGGSLVLGLIHGFQEMVKSGYVDRMPRILAVQSANCAPIYKAWKEGMDEIEPYAMKSTVAEGVALPFPVRGNQVLKALYESESVAGSVNENEIIEAWKTVAQKGLLIEPTSAVAVAGLMKAQQRENIINMTDDVVVIITGHGLKSKADLINEVARKQ